MLQNLNFRQNRKMKSFATVFPKSNGHLRAIYTIFPCTVTNIFGVNRSKSLLTNREYEVTYEHVNKIYLQPSHQTFPN